NIAPADNAVRLALSAAALRDAVASGAPFLAELDEVKSLGADEKFLAPLASYATSGVPTIAILAQELRTLVPAIVKASGGRRQLVVTWNVLRRVPPSSYGYAPLMRRQVTMLPTYWRASRKKRQARPSTTHSSISASSMQQRGHRHKLGSPKLKHGRLRSRQLASLRAILRTHLVGSEVGMISIILFLLALAGV